MKIALIDSGLGLLPAAAALRTLRPDADLVLSSDPDGMPWGPRTGADIAEHALDCARAAAEYRPDALIVACNTASVHALEVIRAELEPVGIPVIGTVPAIKPAAAAALSTAGGPVAIWATPATTGSSYQRGLIRDFAGGVDVTEIPCPGLADAVERADEAAVTEAVAAAAARTPVRTRVVVLGCTHYELLHAPIRAALGASLGAELGAVPTLYGSAQAVAGQALRRAAPDAVATLGGSTLTVLRSGRTEQLPPAALRYREGRMLLGADLPV